MLENSAETIETSVESAETLETTQLSSADATEETTSVDSTEPIEQSSEEEAPDSLLNALLGEDVDTPPDTSGKTVPEGQYLKLKSQHKTMKQELEALRAQSLQPQPAAPQQAPQLTVVAEPPDPEKYDLGTSDPQFMKDFTAYQKEEVVKAVQDQMAMQQQQAQATAYLSKYQTRVDSALPAANQKVEALRAKDAEFNQRMTSDRMRTLLNEIPPEIAASIVENENVDTILNYYSLKPDKLARLNKYNVDEVIDLGKILGKVEGAKNTRAPISKPIKPVKSGKSSTKWHPFKDHDKWNHDDPADHKRWEKAVDAFNKK